VLGIVEEHQLAGRLVDLGVGRDAVQRGPGGDAQVLQGQGIQPIGLAALVEGGDRLAAMDDDVGAGGVLQAAVGAEAGRLDVPGPSQTAPQALAGFLLGLEAARADEAVAVAGLAVPELDLVDHAVAVERMVAAQRLVHRVFGVAQIDAVQVGRDRAFQHLQVDRVDLLVQRRPGAGHVGMVGRLERGAHRGRRSIFMGPGRRMAAGRRPSNPCWRGRWRHRRRRRRRWRWPGSCARQSAPRPGRPRRLGRGR
jgi:hypothetical protein